MKIKSWIIIIVLLFLVNIGIDLSINADLLDSEKEFSYLNQVAEKLRLENEKLNQEIAKLSSITRIIQEAEKLNITKSNQEIVYIIGNSFAKR